MGNVLMNKHGRDDDGQINSNNATEVHNTTL